MEPWGFLETQNKALEARWEPEMAFWSSWRHQPGSPLLGLTRRYTALTRPLLGLFLDVILLKKHWFLLVF